MLTAEASHRLAILVNKVMPDIDTQERIVQAADAATAWDDLPDWIKQLDAPAQESKVRHVRDAAFWGAPVGTPLPLPNAPSLELVSGRPKRRQVRIPKTKLAKRREKENIYFSNIGKDKRVAKLPPGVGRVHVVDPKTEAPKPKPWKSLTTTQAKALFRKRAGYGLAENKGAIDAWIKDNDDYFTSNEFHYNGHVLVRIPTRVRANANAAQKKKINASLTRIQETIDKLMEWQPVAGNVTIGIDDDPIWQYQKAVNDASWFSRQSEAQLRRNMANGLTERSGHSLSANKFEDNNLVAVFTNDTHHAIWLHPRRMYQAPPKRSADWHVIPLKNGDQLAALEYTLVHEWGHLLPGNDTVTGDNSKRYRISEYATNNTAEYIAEAFASWFYDDDFSYYSAIKPEMPLSMLMGNASWDAFKRAQKRHDHRHAVALIAGKMGFGNQIKAMPQATVYVEDMSGDFSGVCPVNDGNGYGDIISTGHINGTVESKWPQNVVRHIRTRAGELRFHGAIGAAIVDHPDVDLGFRAPKPKRSVRVAQMIGGKDRRLIFGKPVPQEELDRLSSMSLQDMPQMDKWPPPERADVYEVYTFADFGDVEVVFEPGFGGFMHPVGFRRHGVVYALHTSENVDIAFLQWSRQGDYSFAEAKALVRHVKDPDYWGLPYNAVIPPGYKPSGPKSPAGKAKALAGKKTKPKKAVSVTKVKNSTAVKKTAAKKASTAPKKPTFKAGALVIYKGMPGKILFALSLQYVVKLPKSKNNPKQKQVYVSKNSPYLKLRPVKKAPSQKKPAAKKSVAKKPVAKKVPPKTPLHVGTYVTWHSDLVDHPVGGTIYDYAGTANNGENMYWLVPKNSPTKGPSVLLGEHWLTVASPDPKYKNGQAIQYQNDPGGEWFNGTIIKSVVNGAGTAYYVHMSNGLGNIIVAEGRLRNNKNVFVKKSVAKKKATYKKAIAKKKAVAKKPAHKPFKYKVGYEVVVPNGVGQKPTLATVKKVWLAHNGNTIYQVQFFSGTIGVYEESQIKPKTPSAMKPAPMPSNFGSDPADFMGTDFLEYHPGDMVTVAPDMNDSSQDWMGTVGEYLGDGYYEVTPGDGNWGEPQKVGEDIMLADDLADSPKPANWNDVGHWVQWQDFDGSHMIGKITGQTEAVYTIKTSDDVVHSIIKKKVSPYYAPKKFAKKAPAKKIVAKKAVAKPPKGSKVSWTDKNGTYHVGTLEGYGPAGGTHVVGNDGKDYFMHYSKLSPLAAPAKKSPAKKKTVNALTLAKGKFSIGDYVTWTDKYGDENVGEITGWSTVNNAWLIQGDDGFTHNIGGTKLEYDTTVGDDGKAFAEGDYVTWDDGSEVGVIEQWEPHGQAWQVTGIDGQANYLTNSELEHHTVDPSDSTKFKKGDHVTWTDTYGDERTGVVIKWDEGAKTYQVKYGEKLWWVAANHLQEDNYSDAEGSDYYGTDDNNFDVDDQVTWHQDGEMLVGTIVGWSDAQSAWIVDDNESGDSFIVNAGNLSMYKPPPKHAAKKVAKKAPAKKYSPSIKEKTVVGWEEDDWVEFGDGQVGQVFEYQEDRGVYRIATETGLVREYKESDVREFSGHVAPKEVPQMVYYKKTSTYSSEWQKKLDKDNLVALKKSPRIEDTTAVDAALESWSMKEKYGSAGVELIKNRTDKINDVYYGIYYPEDGSAPMEVVTDGDYDGYTTAKPINRKLSGISVVRVDVPICNIVPVHDPFVEGASVKVEQYNKKTYVGTIVYVVGNGSENVLYVRNPTTGEVIPYGKDSLTPLDALVPMTASDPRDNDFGEYHQSVYHQVSVNDTAVVTGMDDPTNPAGGDWVGYVLDRPSKTTALIMPAFGAEPVVVDTADIDTYSTYGKLDAYRKKMIKVLAKPLTPEQIEEMKQRKENAAKIKAEKIKARKEAAAKYAVGGEVSFVQKTSLNNFSSKVQKGTITSIDSDGFVIVGSTHVEPTSITKYLTPEDVKKRKAAEAARRAKLIALKNAPIKQGMRVLVAPEIKSAVGKHYVQHSGVKLPKWEGWALRETALGWDVLDDDGNIIAVHRDQMQKALVQKKMPEVSGIKNIGHDGHPEGQGVIPRYREQYKIKGAKVPDIDAYLAQQNADTLHSDQPPNDPNPVAAHTRVPDVFPLKASDPVSIEVDRARESYEEDQLKSFVMFSVARHIIADMQNHGHLVGWVEDQMKKDKNRNPDEWQMRSFLQAVCNGTSGYKGKTHNTTRTARLTSMGLSPEGVKKIEHADDVGGIGSVYKGLSPADKAAVKRCSRIGEVFHLSNYSGTWDAYDEYTDEDLFILNKVDHAVGAWAQSSWSTESVTVQLAAWAVFGLDNRVDRHEGESVTEKNARVRYEKDWPFYEAFVRGVYQNTQDFLATNGIEEVTMFRGMGAESGYMPGGTIPQWVADSVDTVELEKRLAVLRKKSVAEALADWEREDRSEGRTATAKMIADRTRAAERNWDAEERAYEAAAVMRAMTKEGRTSYVDTQPLSSWSTNRTTAQSFGAIMMTATVPAVRIWATTLTGNGCSGEYEYVVIGGNDDPMILEF